MLSGTSEDREEKGSVSSGRRGVLQKTKGQRPAERGNGKFPEGQQPTASSGKKI